MTEELEDHQIRSDHQKRIRFKHGERLPAKINNK